MASENDDKTVVHTCCTALDHFVESEEVASLVAALPKVCGELRAREASEQRFIAILDRYQEQPHLLDSNLEDFLSQLFPLSRQTNDPQLSHQAFRFLYLLSKVRGAKIIVRWFPHEISDLEPALQLLQQQDPNQTQTWETRYILLLWLSILVMVPFDLCRMDGRHDVTSNDVQGQKTVDRIFDMAKMYLGVTDKCRDAASLLLAKFITRPDVKDEKMTEFIDWALTVMNTANSVFHGGSLATLSCLFKHAKRGDVVAVAPTVLARLKGCGLATSPSIPLRKTHVKLVQWLGVVFLPPRLATWRYQRGGRSLEDALATTTTLQSAPLDMAVEEECYDVPEEMEEVLELLLTGLQDSNTVVRWPAAKGIGRVTSSLPHALADEVVMSLLELFTSRESDGAWHGGCLALAELGRRGLLLPQRLGDVVPVVVMALSYDERRGSYSVGAHVRDAACYVSWAFARAYKPEELQPYVHLLSSALLISMLFDREVQCRRAASAAFQENVGRVGNFPHGIEILTAADYFALGILSNAYLNVSIKVAMFPEYCRPLMDHLVQVKLAHWDNVVRELAAKALHNLTHLDAVYIRDEVLTLLLPWVTSADSCLRHGALHAVAEICHALFEQACREHVSFSHYVGAHLTSQLLRVAPRLQEASVFKGAVGEMIRPAALKFIEYMCECGLPVGGGVMGTEEEGEDVLGVWQAIVEDNLTHTEEALRENAVSAFTGLCKTYYNTDLLTRNKYQAQLIHLCTNELLSHSLFVRMGYALALGGLPQGLLAGTNVLRGQVLDPLMKSCAATDGSDPKFTEARKCALTAITRICCTVGISTTSVSSSQPPSPSCNQATMLPALSEDDVHAVFATLLHCLGDYTTNRRGDVGAIVREEAMSSLHTLTTSLLPPHTSLITPDIMCDVMCGLIQQSNEKIDRTRALACRVLVGVVSHDPALLHIPQHSRLLHIFRGKDMLGTEVNYAIPRLTFPLTVQLLGVDEYRYHALLGLIVSVGGLTESTVRESVSALINYLRPVCKDIDSLQPFSDTILQILRNHIHQPRLIVPLFNTLDLLLNNGIFDIYNSLHSHTFPVMLLNLLKVELKGCRDPVKLLASINVVCGLLQFPTIRESALARIMFLLCHSFPRVRKTMADQFYLSLLTFDDLVEADSADSVLMIVSDTVWDGPVSEVREKRNMICELLHLPVPQLLPRAKASSSKPKCRKDDLASYQDLVDRAGY